MSLSFSRSLTLVLLSTVCATALASCARPYTPPEPAPADAPPVSVLSDIPREDIDGRVAALEAEVTALRSDMNRMMPALTRLVNAQVDLQDVLGSLQTTQAAHAAAPAAATAATTSTTTTKATTTTAAPTAKTAAPSATTAAADEQKLERNITPPLSVSQRSALAARTHQENRERQAEKASAAAKAATSAETAVTAPVARTTTDAAGAVAPVTAAGTSAAQLWAPPEGTPQTAPASQASQASQTAAQESSTAAQTPASASRVAGTHAVSLPGGPALIQNVRFGSHPDKTRIVLDVSNATNFSYDIDNAENILMITLPQAQRGQSAETGRARASLTESYRLVSDGKDGTVLAVQLKQKARVIAAEPLPGVSGAPARIMIDIAPL